MSKNQVSCEASAVIIHVLLTLPLCTLLLGSAIGLAIWPAAAQGSDSLPATTIDSAKYPLAANAEVTQVDEAPPSADTPPGDEWPAHILVTLPSYFDVLNLNPDEFPVLAQVQIFRTSKFETFGWSDQLQQLTTLLQPQLAFLTTPSAPPAQSTLTFGAETPLSLPFLPAIGSRQVIYAKARSFTIDVPAAPTPPIQGVFGIVYLAAYRQDVSPFTPTDIFFTFQGTTFDQQYYVSATFPVQLNVKLEAFDPATADATKYQQYLDSVRKVLNEADPDSAFTPPLPDLDMLISSLRIDWKQAFQQ
jgi:hypothetical protein